MGTPASSSTRFPVPGASAEKPHTSELTIRKSRFLASSCQCGDAESAREFVARIRREHADATHNCWAFAAGAPGSTASVGYSDDGEPHGTAGRPILQTLLHSGMGRICMVVTRWFGGIKLGTGGLSRAYQESALENLRGLPTLTAVERKKLRLALDYGYLDGLRRLLPAYEAVLTDEQYAAKAGLALSIPVDRLEAFRKAAMDLSNGLIVIKEQGDG